MLMTRGAMQGSRPSRLVRLDRLIELRAHLVDQPACVAGDWVVGRGALASLRHDRAENAPDLLGSLPQRPHGPGRRLGYRLGRRMLEASRQEASFGELEIAEHRRSDEIHFARSRRPHVMVACTARASTEIELLVAAICPEDQLAVRLVELRFFEIFAR